MRVPLKITLMAALLVAVSASSSWALIEQYLPGGANIKMKFTNYDIATFYDIPDAAYTIAGTEYTGALLAGLSSYRDPSIPAGEDSWGIFSLESIYEEIIDPITGMPSTATLWSKFWSPGGAGVPVGYTPFEITGIFWGEVDKSVTAVLNKDKLGNYTVKSQVIKGDDLKFAFFEDLSPDYNPSVPGNRAGIDFPTVTDGTCIWTGVSVPQGGPTSAYEYYSIYTPATKNGDGNFKGMTSSVSGLDKDGNPITRTGSLNWLMADLEEGVNFDFQFTAYPASSTPGQWPLWSDDPVRATITPELSTSWLMLLGMVPVGMAWRRRKRS